MTSSETRRTGVDHASADARPIAPAEHKPGPTPARLTEHSSDRRYGRTALRSRPQGDRRGAPNSRDSTTKHTGLPELRRSCAFAVVAVGCKWQQTACSVSVFASWPRSARASANPDGERRMSWRGSMRCAHQADLCRLLDHLGSHRRHSIPVPQQVSSLPISCARPREMRLPRWEPIAGDRPQQRRTVDSCDPAGPSLPDQRGAFVLYVRGPVAPPRRKLPPSRHEGVKIVTAGRPLGVAWQARASDIPAALRTRSVTLLAVREAGARHSWPDPGWLIRVE
jgi:hypothetical protein